jgi:HlyD family secretion protein
MNLKGKKFTLLLAILFVFSGFSVIKALASGPATVSTAADAAKAERVAVPTTGGADDRGTPPVSGRVAGNGMVEPAQREVKVAAAVPGLITRVLAVEGQRVEAGAPLVELESSAENAALAAAEADLNVSQSELTRVRKGLRDEDVDAAVADAEAARARSELSRSNLARIETRPNTAEELDRARQNAANDEATWRAIDARKRAARFGSRAEDVAVAVARVAAATARRDQAAAVVGRLTVRAPISGEVLEVKFLAGEYYNPQGAEPLLVMGDTSVLRVRMDVEERDLEKVSLGQVANITADAFKGQTFKGKVVEIGKRMGRKNFRTDEPTERLDTKILEVVIQLEGASKLVPGQRVLSVVEPIAGKG